VTTSAQNEVGVAASATVPTDVKTAVPTDVPPATAPTDVPPATVPTDVPPGVPADPPADSLVDVELRVGAYAVVHDHRGVLLAHWREGAYGGWTLPGGGLEPGEHPEQTVVREEREETGYTVSVDGLIGVESQVIAAELRVPGPGPTMQLLRIVYRCTVVAGELQAELQGSTDDVGWFLIDNIAALQHVQLVDDGLRFAGLDQ